VRDQVSHSYKTRPSPGPCVTFRNVVSPCPTAKLEDNPLSAVRDCLFSIFSTTRHVWRSSPPSATCGRSVPWHHIICDNLPFQKASTSDFHLVSCNMDPTYFKKCAVSNFAVLLSIDVNLLHIRLIISSTDTTLQRTSCLILDLATP
jgi:hypothetical protein